jgi:hypothetical protein
MPSTTRVPRVITRRTLAVLCLVASIAAPYSVARAATVSRGTNITAKICAVATACPTIEAVARSTTTAHEVSVFLNQLWFANFKGGTQGTYQLQRCENSGSVPYRVECVLFSTGTDQDLSALRNVFDSSRLFTIVDAVS